MLYTEEVSWMSKSGYSDIELLEYIDKYYDEIECELNGEVYKEPKKHDHNFCMDCNVVKTIDYKSMSNLMRLNVNLMGKSIKRQKSMIVIFVWTVN